MLEVGTEMTVDVVDVGAAVVAVDEEAAVVDAVAVVLVAEDVRSWRETWPKLAPTCSEPKRPWDEQRLRWSPARCRTRLRYPMDERPKRQAPSGLASYWATLLKKKNPIWRRRRRKREEAAKEFAASLAAR